MATGIAADRTQSLCPEPEVILEVLYMYLILYSQEYINFAICCYKCTLDTVQYSRSLYLVTANHAKGNHSLI